MNQKTKYIGLMALLPLAMIAFAQESEGTPSQVSPKSYGQATDDIVCGAQLCSTPAGSPDPVNEGRAQ